MLIKILPVLVAALAVANAREIPRRTVDIVPNDFNSGVIPGTNITIYGLTDPDGKPLDFSKFMENFVPFDHTSDTVDVKTSNGHGFSKRSCVNGICDGKLKHLRMLCIPQISVNPIANPYHDDLLSHPRQNEFNGHGHPIVYPIDGLYCTPELAGACTLTITDEVSYSNVMAYAVSDSKSNSVSKNVGGSKSSSNSSSIALTISESIEHSSTVSDTHTTEESSAHQFGDVTTKGWEKGNVTLHSDTKGNDTTHGSNHVDESNKNYHVEGSACVAGTASVNAIVVSASVTTTLCVSGGGGGGSSKSDGTNDSKTDNLSDTNSFSGNLNDNWSQATTDMTTETKGSSDAHTTSSTDGKTSTNSRMKTTGVEVTAAEDWGSSNSTEVGGGTTNTTTSTITTTRSVGKSVQVPLGKCMRAICFPDVYAYVVPYICVDTVTQIAERAYATVTKPRPTNGYYACNVAFALCKDVDDDTIPPMVSDSFASLTSTNSLRIGGVIDAAATSSLKSTNGIYEARVEKNGNFIIYKSGTVKVWETGATPFFGSQYSHRVRINMRGHLVIESTNLWSNVNPVFREDEFVQIWSTQKFGNNYTVGNPRRPDSSSDDYFLHLDDNGRLMLYDASYIMIWCSFDRVGKPCVNGKGFKYQENYLVPTDFPVIDEDQGQDDPHNSILFDTKVRKESSIVSMDANCDSGINGGEGIQSPNGRFKVLLYPTGNLVIKDGFRDMFVGYTSNMPNGTAPYRLVVTFEGDLVVTDATDRWIWVGGNLGDRLSPPYTATILDEGRLVVRSSKGADVWESWPHRGLNSAARLGNQLRLCYRPCGRCDLDVNNVTTTTITATNTIMAPTTTIATTSYATITSAPSVPKPNSENILNKCQKWMDDYKMDPFVSYGSMTDAAMQVQWGYYDCACFGIYLKYKVEILRTHLGKWGSLKDAAVRKLYTDSNCNCAIGQDIYKILPVPKNWGSLTDKTLQNRWNAEKCDADINKEPFIRNPNGSTSPGQMVTLTNYTTNIMDAYVTNYVNTTQTMITNNTITITAPPPKTTYITAVTTGIITNVTVSVTDMQTVAITTGITITTAEPTVMPTKTTTNVTKPTQTAKCSSGYFGKGTGKGPSGACCKTEQDCGDSCMNGMCGVCGKDFIC